MRSRDWFGATGARERQLRREQHVGVALHRAAASTITQWGEIPLPEAPLSPPEVEALRAATAEELQWLWDTEVLAADDLYVFRPGAEKGQWLRVMPDLGREPQARGGGGGGGRRARPVSRELQDRARAEMREFLGHEQIAAREAARAAVMGQLAWRQGIPAAVAARALEVAGADVDATWDGTLLALDGVVEGEDGRLRYDPDESTWEKL